MEYTTAPDLSKAFSARMQELLKKYFSSRKKTGGVEMFVKVAILFGALAILLTALYSANQPWWVCLIAYFGLGFVFPALGFNVMHDALHGTLSSIPWVNRFFGYTLNFLGGIWEIWDWQHNRAHHMNTNVDGVDHDIDVQPLGRFHPNQRRYWFHKWQHVYFPWIIYPLSYLAWITILDLQKAFLMRKEGKFGTGKFIYMFVSKCVHFFIFIGLPLMVYPAWAVLLGYLIMSLMTGSIISPVFQMAHAVEKTEMVEAPKEGNIKFDVVHQLRTTADFATDNKLISWYVGGLNFQIEHHLYYYVSHIHYPAIHKMVVQVCKELNLPHHEYPKFILAFDSHIRLLKQLGRAA
jgi:linoleoyl-CoA desaturase